MPANYTGNSTATQAPASTPASGAAPIVVTPSDGDALNAASILQALKVLADYDAFQLSPFPTASAWTQMAKIFRNAKLYSGFLLDHEAMPAGRIFVKDENWDRAALANGIGTGVWGNSGWNYRIHGGTPAGIISNAGPGASLSTVPWGPLAQLTLNSGHAQTLLLEYGMPLMLMSSTSFSMAFDFSITGASDPDASTSYAIGLGDGSLLADLSDNPFDSGGVFPVGSAIFANGTAGADWNAYAFPPGGAAHVTVLGTTIARNAVHRMKMVVLGTGSADDSAAKVQFFLDGALVVTLAYSLTNAMLVPFIRVTTGGVDVTTFNVGPVQFRGRLALGDVAF